MFKKIIAAVVALAMISIPVLAEISFGDLPAAHWGYSVVEKLVNDGTVKGYEDGTFRPDATVTRAEFVKMMGVGTVTRPTPFSDVDQNHWAYQYVMTSEFDTGSDKFLPDQPITRGETLDLLWKRAGSIKGLITPSVITNQYPKNKDAVSWAYNYKIMIGDDGLNLRLSDSLSRVEAAALIVRARETNFENPQINFKDTVSDATLKAVFESFKLFDSNVTYSPDKTITNGEMARAALRIAANEKNLTYNQYVYTEPKETFDYHKDATIVTSKCIKDGIVTKDYVQKPATINDTLSALSFAIIQKANTPLSYGNINNYYKDVTKIDSKENVFLTFAYENGVQLNADGTIGFEKPVTHKDFAALLIQIDEICGTQTAFTTVLNSKNVYETIDVKLNKNIATYPSNSKDFGCIEKDVPKEVYELPITSTKVASANFDFAREYGQLFAQKLSSFTKNIKTQYGVDCVFVMFPSVCWDTGKGFEMRVRCDVKSVSKSVNIEDIFGTLMINPTKGELKEGMSFFISIPTGYAIFM